LFYAAHETQDPKRIAAASLFAYLSETRRPTPGQRAATRRREEAIARARAALEELHLVLPSSARRLAQGEKLPLSEVTDGIEPWAVEVARMVPDLYRALSAWASPVSHAPRRGPSSPAELYDAALFSCGGPKVGRQASPFTYAEAAQIITPVGGWRRTAGKRARDAAGEALSKIVAEQRRREEKHLRLLRNKGMPIPKKR
jgi:hypothetical protein